MLPDANKTQVLKFVEGIKSRNCQDNPHLCLELTKVRDTLEKMPAVDVLPFETVQNAGETNILRGLKQRAAFSSQFYQHAAEMSRQGKRIAAAHMGQSLNKIRAEPLYPNTILAGLYAWSPRGYHLYGIPHVEQGMSEQPVRVLEEMRV